MPKRVFQPFLRLLLIIPLILSIALAGSQADSQIFGESCLSRTFNFTSLSGNIELSWWQWYHIFEPFDNGRVLINNQEVWHIPDNNPTAGWVQNIINLGAYSGRESVTIQFALQASSEVNRMGWYIDNLQITSNSLPVYFEDFEGGDGGWVPSGPTNWQYGPIVTSTFKNCGFTALPYPEPTSTYSGTKGWGTVLDGCYNNYSGPFINYFPLIFKN